ncbi:MAG TPA: glycosyltransferase family 2 protein [Pyrinomonadaceae bacterium]|nr:glycosyltransferase family 2 protein [Pyrinomonadaceae bacterium]
MTSDVKPASSAELLIASSTSATQNRPFLTIGIPHYKHRRYLEIVLASLFAQSYKDFEIVVSDDCSPDDSNQVIPEILKQGDIPFRYYAQTANLGYDGNVRFCLRAARGRYVFLLGNDDALAEPATLDQIVSALQELGLPDVAFTNYEDWKTGTAVRNALSTSLLGSGPEVAAANFRSFSFVSGAIYNQEAALKYETDRWDQSIYYQIYIACRIVAAGGKLAAIDNSAIRKDIRVGDHGVPNYASKWANEPWSFQSRHTGLDSVIRVTADAVMPAVAEGERSAMLRRIVSKILMSTYPYWLFEYRRVSNWSFSAGIARGLWPGTLLSPYKLTIVDRLYLWMLYLAATFVGLFTPIRVLSGLHPKVARIIRRQQQATPATVQS